MTSGFILIDKPTDWTSNDVVVYLRGVAKTKKTGHSGTLDPFATGLLIVGVGRNATKHLDGFHTFSKTYEAEITLGATSDTQDKTGVITSTKNFAEHFSATNPSKEKIIETIKKFVGEQTQIPPMFSAKKIAGKKMYKIARKGGEVVREPIHIYIESMDLFDYDFPALRIRATVSTGTYIRTLAHDIGSALGTGAYCSDLRRTQIGPYSATQALNLKTMTQEDIHSHLFFPDELVSGIKPKITHTNR